MPQLLGEGLGLLVVGEVAAREAVVADRVDHPVDDLAQAALAARVVHAVAEVLRGDDAHRRVGPVERELAVVLPEDLALGPAVARGLHDDGLARTPRHLVVGMRPRTGEPARDRERAVGHRGRRVSRHLIAPWWSSSNSRRHLRDHLAVRSG